LSRGYAASRGHHHEKVSIIIAKGFLHHYDVQSTRGIKIKISTIGSIKRCGGSSEFTLSLDIRLVVSGLDCALPALPL
jgi:hypothetical protein